MSREPNRTEPNRHVTRTETNRPADEPNRPYLRFPRTETNRSLPGEGFSTTEFFVRQKSSAKESLAKIFAWGRYGYTHAYIHIILYDTFNVR